MLMRVVTISIDHHIGKRTGPTYRWYLATTIRERIAIHYIDAATTQQHDNYHVKGHFLYLYQMIERKGWKVSLPLVWACLSTLHLQH